MSPGRYAPETTDADHVTTRLSMDARSAAGSFDTAAQDIANMPEILGLLGDRVDADPLAVELIDRLLSGIERLEESFSKIVEPDSLTELTDEHLLLLGAYFEARRASLDEGYSQIAEELGNRATTTNRYTIIGRRVVRAHAHHSSVINGKATG